MSHTIYDRFVLEDRIEDMLATKVDLNNYLHVDNSLAENPGMLKKIHKYIATGDVDEVAMGEGNTNEITVSYAEEEYRVGTTQGKFVYYDEEEMTDPMVVETGLQGLADKMTNDFTAKAIAEFGKANLIHYGCQWKYADVVDAIALFPYEDEAGLWMLINPKQLASFRKNLGDDLKYVEANVRTGYIGSVCGVPVSISKAVPDGKAFIGTNEAVTLFLKKGSEIEQDRVADTRKNSVFARKVALVALTDATRIVKLSANSDPREGYEVLSTKPDDWATSYTDAFTYDNVNEEMVAVTGESAPAFVAGKYWVAED